jgi:hypothetical protein
VRIQSSHHHEDRGLDAYFSPPEAVWSLLHIEAEHFPGCRPDVKGIVTNPPYRLAVQFAEKALTEVGYVALLLRTNFLESTARLAFFRRHPPARIWISSRRLPMMHRQGWQGPRAPSNTCFAWFIWDSQAEQTQVLDWFDWRAVPVGAIGARPVAAA